MRDMRELLEILLYEKKQKSKYFEKVPVYLSEDELYAVKFKPTEGGYTYKNYGKIGESDNILDTIKLATKIANVDDIFIVEYVESNKSWNVVFYSELSKENKKYSVKLHEIYTDFRYLEHSGIGTAKNVIEAVKSVSKKVEPEKIIKVELSGYAKYLRDLYKQKVENKTSEFEWTVLSYPIDEEEYRELSRYSYFSDD